MGRDIRGGTVKPGLQDAAKFNLVGQANGTVTRYDIVQQTGALGDKADCTRASSAALATARGILYMAKGSPDDNADFIMSTTGQIQDIDTSSAAVGDPVYLSTAGGVALTPGAVPRVVGTVTVAATVANGGKIQFNGFLDTAAAGIEGIIADPGDAGAISVVRSGVVNFVTAGVETRSLAAPAYVGQRVSIHMDTDGGTATITSAVAINAAGNTVMTFADVRDFIELLGITVGGALQWTVVANAGVTLA